MDGVSADHQEQKFQSAHQLYLATKRSFRDLDIPPRMLLSRRIAALSSEPSMEIYHQIHHHQNDSPRVLPEDTLFQKFLPNSGADDDSDPYASDEFRMYEFKIRKCTRSRSHDWTDCPFAHPGEKARRRCPRRFHYSGDVCPDFRRGSCIRGDICEFSHGVFECWLHPSRYRTEACKDGKECQRKICFFAHTPNQLRSPSPTDTMVSPGKHFNAGHCSSCRCHTGIHLHNNSPTSILDMEQPSPPCSPPFSPAKPGGGFSPAQPGGGFSPLSRFSDKFVRTESTKGLMTHQAIEELMHSVEAMNMNAIDQGSNMNPNFTDSYQQSFFSLSPSTPSSSACGSSRVFPGACKYPMNTRINEEKRMTESSTTCPDLNWVNDLLT